MTFHADRTRLDLPRSAQTLVLALRSIPHHDLVSTQPAMLRKLALLPPTFAPTLTLSTLAPQSIVPHFARASWAPHGLNDTMEIQYLQSN